ncbi:GntR family transcriptional regulator [Oryzibacter oryziterrae]|uniref:GntR family transcriptional regulator n=1 Tax=Oryzibacter oryziterrae TaxID=2766474 RepID=UPI001F2D3AD9|nr:GntR family transcriptional regulator [Oryzibacter oryziterrae]
MKSAVRSKVKSRRISISAPRPDGRTRTEGLRHDLADAIVSGEFEPGTALDEVRLASRFGVSRTPVREALRQLSASGLVEIRPHRGAIVAKLDERQLHDMFVTMAELEAACAGLAAQNMTTPERRQLEAIHDELRELVRIGEPESYNVVNESFHSAIYVGAHNSYLFEITQQTRTRIQPFRRAQFRTIGRLQRSFEEHDHVVAAILRGDREAAYLAMRQHLISVEEAYDAYAEAH